MLDTSQALHFLPTRGPVNHLYLQFANLTNQRRSPRVCVTASRLYPCRQLRLVSLRSRRGRRPKHQINTEPPAHPPLSEARSRSPRAAQPSARALGAATSRYARARVTPTGRLHVVEACLWRGVARRRGGRRKLRALRAQVLYQLLRSPQLCPRAQLQRQQPPSIPLPPRCHQSLPQRRLLQMLARRQVARVRGLLPAKAVSFPTSRASLPCESGVARLPNGDIAKRGTGILFIYIEYPWQFRFSVKSGCIRPDDFYRSS